MRLLFIVVVVVEVVVLAIVCLKIIAIAVIIIFSTISTHTAGLAGQGSERQAGVSLGAVGARVISAADGRGVASRRNINSS